MRPLSLDYICTPASAWGLSAFSWAHSLPLLERTVHRCCCWEQQAGLHPLAVSHTLHEPEALAVCSRTQGHPRLAPFLFHFFNAYRAALQGRASVACKAQHLCMRNTH